MSLLDTFRTAIFGPEHDASLSPKQKGAVNSSLESDGVVAVDRAFKETKNVDEISKEVQTQKDIANHQKEIMDKDVNPMLSAAKDAGGVFAKLEIDWTRSEAVSNKSPSQGASADLVAEKFKAKGADEGIA